MRETIPRVAAGVITPALSMLFSLIGDVLYSFDARSFQPMLLAVVPAAAILGAPLAVPAALLIRLQHVWRCIPLIALCAALGIQLQIYLGGLAEDRSSLSLILMFVWLLPAVLGTGAALLLKWNERLYLAAAPIFVALMLALTVKGAILARERAPALAAARSWSVLRAGLPVYTGGDPKGQRVCASLTALFAAERQQSASCFTVTRGVGAVVDAIIPCEKTDPHAGYDSAHVRIHARDGTWRGFTEADYLQPDVPEGTLLELERNWSAPLVIEDDGGAQTVIGGSALVRLLRYDPSRDASLYVEVVSGHYRALRGWTYIQNVDNGGVALGEYDMEYPYTDCVQGWP